MFVPVCLETGAGPNANNYEGFRSLHQAATFGKSPAMIRALLDAGADPNAGTHQGHTPLPWAAERIGGLSLPA